MTDDDQDYPPEGGCIGFGAMHDLGPSGRKRQPPPRPIGFVHFPDKPEKPKRPTAKKVRRRKK